ncbi:exported hypothetical protein [Paraburkholderia tropica]|uniref:hypothetical protein n=1 Tax=Paraburkholderia tropica TaxID=92647 RepID=UPI001CB40089|nr:hypothetical protein [Paraburkholderia tropica]CAG9237756.1 exported hypothetical protein [Paraburkholderia tropica]
MKLYAAIVCTLTIVEIGLANAQVPIAKPEKIADFASQVQATADKIAAVPKIPLMLLSDLQDATPQMVMLRERDGRKCSYIGELKPSRNMWSISITRKNCPDGLSSPAALVVPLRNLATEPGYAAGSTVIAYQVIGAAK